jgi:acyl-CoA reductase-like NAD-dependent aldehyde dehydrogenase
MDAIRHYSMLINGDWADTADRFEIRSPATEELVATVAKGSTGQAVAAARAAARRADDTEYGLSAGVWSTDTQLALDVAGQLEADTVWVNDWHMVSAAYPFGGFKQSGLGRELGPHALDEYTEEKFVHVGLSGRLERRGLPVDAQRGDGELTEPGP